MYLKSAPLGLKPKIRKAKPPRKGSVPAQQSSPPRGLKPVREMREHPPDNTKYVLHNTYAYRKHVQYIEKTG